MYNLIQWITQHGIYRVKMKGEMKKEDWVYLTLNVTTESVNINKLLKRILSGLNKVT